MQGFKTLTSILLCVVVGMLLSFPALHYLFKLGIFLKPFLDMWIEYWRIV